MSVRPKYLRPNASCWSGSAAVRPRLVPLTIEHVASNSEVCRGVPSSAAASSSCSAVRIAGMPIGLLLPARVQEFLEGYSPIRVDTVDTIHDQANLDCRTFLYSVVRAWGAFMLVDGQQQGAPRTHARIAIALDWWRCDTRTGPPSLS